MQPTRPPHEATKAQDDAPDRIRTLSSWAKNTGDRRSSKIKRWQTLPLKGPNSFAAAVASGRADSNATKDSVFGLNSSWANTAMSYSSLSFEQKNEVDLSIAALQNLLEGFPASRATTLQTSPSGVPQLRPSSPANTSRVREQILNVIYLLQKFQVDASVSSALRESKLRRFVSQNFVRQRGNINNTEDREVAQWISENVFAPTELRRIATDAAANDARASGTSSSGTAHPSASESAQDFFAATTRSRNSVDGDVPVGSSAVVSAALNNASLKVHSLASRMSARRSSVPPYAEAGAQSPPHSGPAPTGRVTQPSPSVSSEEEELEAAQTDAERIENMLLTPPVAQCLTGAHLWNFDIFTLASLSGHSPLLLLSTHLFNTLGLFEKFSIPHLAFTNFMRRIEAGYLDNAYHNALHAADVLQNMYYFLRQPSFSEKISPIDVFASLIAAAVHDVGHPGTNNAFQIAINSDLAVAYNDRSVLENFHLAEAFRAMKHPGCDIFCGLSADARKEIRESMIVMILATDMQVHLHVMSELQTSIESKREANTWFDSKSRQDSLLCLKVGLHCADVANPTKPLHLYKNWVDRLVTEWYKQGDDERRLGLTVSPLMDRDKPNVARSQVGFIDFFIRPLFETWVIIVPESKELMENLLSNRAYYESLAATPAGATGGHSAAPERGSVIRKSVSGSLLERSSAPSSTSPSASSSSALPLPIAEEDGH